MRARVVVLLAMLAGCSGVLIKPITDGSFITRSESGAMLALPATEATEVVVDRMTERGLALIEDTAHDGARILMFRGGASVFAIGVQPIGGDRTSITILGRRAIAGIDDKPVDATTWASRNPLLVSAHGEIEVIVAVLAELDKTGLVLGPPASSPFRRGRS
jgi:hypothetical protein